MHQRDLYVVYVKQYCGSVNTFRAICFSCFEDVRGLLPIGLKLALMLYLCNFSNFFFFFGLKHLDQSDDSVPAPERITEQPWESIIFAFPWKSSVFLPFGAIFETPWCSVHSKRERWQGTQRGLLCSLDGLHHTRSPVLSAGRQLWCSASLISRPARLMKWWHFLRK